MRDEPHAGEDVTALTPRAENRFAGEPPGGWMSATAETEPSNVPIPPAERVTGSCEGDPTPGREDTPEPRTTKEASVVKTGVKVWWHREDPARPHLPGAALHYQRRYARHATHPLHRTDPARRRDRHRRRLGPPPPASLVGGLPDPARRRRARAGGRHRRPDEGTARSAHRGERRRDHGDSHRERGGPDRGRAGRATRAPGERGARTVAGRTASTDADRDVADAAGPCRPCAAPYEPRIRPADRR